VFNQTCRRGHPAAKFGWGNYKSLVTDLKHVVRWRQ
jgi:hypothetical protein